MCKTVYHIVSRPPKQADVCDACGATLMQREDDRPEAIRVRMHAYQRSTAPLTEFYEKRKLLVEVPAHGTPDDIFQRTLSLLHADK